ncbi:MAG: hypothetical protein U0168_10950 [Nannocystaceae bacterium]
MARLGHGSIRWQRPERSRAASSCVALAAVLVGCADPPERELPDPPDGAELVLEIGELEVYKAFDGELCAGTLRRIELHANGLADLFDMDPPRARVFLYDDVDAVDEVCHFNVETHGCADWWGTNALPDVVTHELVHVFVNAATGVRTRPAIQEGVAWALQGDWLVPGRSALTYEQLEALLAVDSPFDVAEAGGGAHFFAWAIDRFGAAAVLDAHAATATANSDQEVESALAGNFGFDSLPSLYAEYVATRALEYPPIMDLAVVLTGEELAAGTTLDTSCAGAATEGPTNGEITTRVLLEVAGPGEYGIEYRPLPPCPPRWRSTEPVFDRPDDELQVAEMCAFDQDPPHVVFHLSGHYEISFGDVWCPAVPPAQVTLSSRFLNGGDECTAP